VAGHVFQWVETRLTLNRIVRLAFLLLPAALPAAPQAALSARDPLEPYERAFRRTYDFDFAGAHAILDREQANDPGNPMLHAARGMALLFTEFNRLRVLDEFFSDDDQGAPRSQFSPDSAARRRLFAATGEARRLAGRQLAAEPNERYALLALCVAAAVEAEYTILVEKKYVRSYPFSAETRKLAGRLLALDPPVADAWFALGSVEYVVSDLNPFSRLMARLDLVESSRPKAVENLQRVIGGGRLYPAFARILLSVVYLREKQPAKALILLRELERDFPDNSLFHRQAAAIQRKADQAEAQPRR
jgi:hypothetical protein